MADDIDGGVHETDFFLKKGTPCKDKHGERHVVWCSPSGDILKSCSLDNLLTRYHEGEVQFNGDPMEIRGEAQVGLVTRPRFCKT